MLTSNSGEAQDLTEDEIILHHHVAIVKKDVEAYRAHSSSENDWLDLFKDHLACFILIIHFYKPF